MSNTELMALMVLTPFAILGVRALANILVEKTKVNKGFFKIQLILPNRRMKDYFAKPTGDEIKIGNKRLGFDNSADKIAYKGTTPVIQYDTKSAEQLSFKSNSECPVDPEYFDNIVVRAYNLGKLSAIVNEQKLLLVCIIACIVGGVSIVVGGMNYLKLMDIAKAIAPAVVG